MNKMMRLVLVGILVCLVFASHSSAGAFKSGTDQTISLLSSTQERLVYKVTFPQDQLEIQEVSTAHGIYTRVSVPGWSQISQAGAPMLPYLAESIGVPFAADVQVQVTPGASHTLKLSHPLMPVSVQEVTWQEGVPAAALSAVQGVNTIIEMDPLIYQGTSLFPDRSARLVNDGILRHQRVVSVAAYPLQYDPLNSALIIYDSLLIEVRFSQSQRVPSAAFVPDAGPFEAMLQANLLNYDSARGMRQVKVTPDALAPGGYDAQGVIDRVSWSPPDPGWRISVREEGLYQLTFAQMAAAGIPVDTLDFDTLQLFHQGVEVAIQVNPGVSIVFYGQALESKYSRDNIYWLTYGKASGSRMGTRAVIPASASTPVSFSNSIHLENNKYYTSRGSGEFEHFLWDYVTWSRSWSQAFALPGYAGGDVVMRVSILGHSQDEQVSPDHHASIAINGSPVKGDILWDGWAWQAVEVTVPAALLLPGDNTIVISAVNDTGASRETFYIDHLEFDYARTFEAQGDALSFAYGLPGTWLFDLPGFSSDQLVLLDISDPTAAQCLTGFQVNSDTSAAPFSLQFQDTLSQDTTYWAAAVSQYKSVSAIEADQPSDLHASENSADYIVITHADFWDEAGDLVEYRQGQGLRSVRVDVQDVYDEFNYGIVDSQAIHDFLSYTFSTWTTPSPSFVVLVGDGHYDPNDYLGKGRTSFIPPYLANIDPTIDETAADNRYVAFGTDALPDMMIGRLAVNTPAEAAVMINKLVAYEQNPPEGDWKLQVLAIADKPAVGDEYDWISDALLNDLMPADPFQAERIYWQITHTDLSEARTAIKDGFNQGKLLINYIGHGYYGGWGLDTLFSTSDIASLAAQDKLPIILPMTCMEGYFVSPYTYSWNMEAMGEVITRTAGKGAVASWSPTGWGTTVGHDALNRGFFEALFQDGSATLGEAAQAGKLKLWASGYNLDLLDTYMLFGDPALHFALDLVAVADGYQLYEDVPLSVAAAQGLLANDINPEQAALSAVLVASPQYGQLVLAADGSFTYTPAPDHYGEDSFTYKINDGSGESNTARVFLTINPVNDPPLAQNQEVSTYQNIALSITLEAVDDGSQASMRIVLDPVLAGSALPHSTGLDYMIVDQPQQGSLTPTGSAEVYIYLPRMGFTGTDSFTFKVNDGEYYSNTATVTIQVYPGYQVYLPLITR